MKIEPGKRYVTRNGGSVGPLIPNTGINRKVFPWVPQYDTRPSNAYKDDGSYSDERTHNLDAVSEVPESVAPASVVVRDTSDATNFAWKFAEYLNLMAGEIHRANARFYQDINTGAPIDRNPGEMLALIHSEVSEMLEGVRKGKMDDHLPDRTAEEVEAADVLIRLLDYCCFRRLDLGGATLAKLAYNATRADHSLEARRAPGGKKF